MTSNKKSWMFRLALHYTDMRRRYPHDKLIILFDIDGTILDMRHLVLHTLRAYDRKHATHFFQKLRFADINVHEDQVDQLLANMPVPPAEIEGILSWYEENQWSSEAILESHRPFSGVLEVIRWFQIQPATYVGLNTGRPESIRGETLSSLNKLGQEYRVQFKNDLLHMAPGDWNEEKVVPAKVEGVRYFQKLGYRVFAFMDNEPENLEAVAQADGSKEILLLHADTIFASKRVRLRDQWSSGEEYDLTDLISKESLPKHIQFVRQGVNDKSNLSQFLTSDISWAECDIRLDPTGREPILRGQSFEDQPLMANEEWMLLDELLAELKANGKGTKMDLKSGGLLVDHVLELAKSHAFDDHKLWFNGRVEHLQEHRFRQLKSAYPEAIIQCPVDFLAPLICSVPQKAKEILDIFSSWGINRFSISWQTVDKRQFFDQMDRLGFDVNIYDVPDLESFLQAVLLMPCSVTSQFNFPKWRNDHKPST